MNYNAVIIRRLLALAWQADGGQPHIGPTMAFERSTVGESRIEAEAVMPDGRRIFGKKYLEFNSQNGGANYTSPDPQAVALYHFDDNSQPSLYFKDATGHYNLSQIGFPALQGNNSWMQNSAGYAVRFGGIGDSLKISIPDDVLRPSGSAGFTIEFRMYIKRLPSSGLLYLFRLAQTDPEDPNRGDSNEWSVKYKASDAPFPRIFGPEGAVVLNSDGWNAKITPNTWHLVKVTTDFTGTYSDTTKVYVDDMVNPAGSQSCSHFLTSGADWTLSMGDFEGDLDEVRISSVVR